MSDIVERLRDFTNTETVKMRYEAAGEIEALRQICRDAYEVYAGSEGIPTPETAAEAYLFRLFHEMLEEIERGLK